MGIRLAFLLFTLCLLPLAAGAGEAPRAAIAILPFDSSLDRKFKPLADAMPDLLTACFTTENVAADIVERADLAAIAAEQTAHFDASRFSQIKGATHLLRGSLAPQGDDVVMTFMLYDLGSAKLAASATASGGVGELPETACKGVRDLGAQIPGLRTAPAPMGTVSEAEAEYDRLLMEGFNAYYSGAFGKAFPAFLKLVHQHPDDATPDYWLAKSYQGAGMAEEAETEFAHFIRQFPKDARAAEVSDILKGMSKPKEKAKDE